MKFLVLVCFLYSIVVVKCQSGKLLVNIPKIGRIQGSSLESSSNRSFQAFRGIPYAQPPIGDLRFKDPLPAKPWGDDVLDATKEGPTCVQYDSLQYPPIIKGQEDCLALNIYTPSNNYAKDSLPVMVWIHGGAWFLGSGNFETDFYGPRYLLDRDVVLVTINYRLGPMGFLSTEDSEAPGNYGLLDQTLALKWVRNHISHFGGDPNSITIFGESAGGASVNFQVLSPLSKGLFDRAIMQSGATSCPWALQRDVGEYTKTLAQLVNCPTSSSKEILKCLRQKTPEEIVLTREKISLPVGLGLFPIAFGPRIDAERETPFLPDEPAKMIARKEFNHVPIIAGVTADEGGLFSAPFAAADYGQVLLSEFNKDPLENVKYAINMEKREYGEAVAKKVYEHYFLQNKKPDVIGSYGQLLSDYGFFKCVDDAVKLFSQHSRENVFYYHYAHKSKMSFLDSLGVPADMDFGAVHGDELFLMFSSSLAPPITDSNDIGVSKMMLDLWTSFARSGLPQSKNMEDSWLPTKKDQPSYLNISTTPKLVHGPMPFDAKLGFWNQLLGQERKNDEL